VNAVSSDGVFFTNVTFRGNSGPCSPQCCPAPKFDTLFDLVLSQRRTLFSRGLLPNAGVQGSGFCSTSLRMADSLWLANTAQYGGALYAGQGCNLAVHNTTFANNYAQVRPRDNILLGVNP